MSPESMQRICSLDDPRVAPYRSLRDRTLRGESLFVAEGRLLVLRLLQSDYRAESVFVADPWADEFRPLVPDHVPMYVAAESLLLQVVGFKFHRGVLAVGRRPAPVPLDALLAAIERPENTAGPVAEAERERAAAAERSDTPRPTRSALRLVICPEVTKPENLGLVFRAAAAFGVHDVLLGERCCDPLSRRSLRVSMGAVLGMPRARSADLLADLRQLRDRWGVTLLAAVLDPQAERLAESSWPPRAAVLLGNETDGLRQQYLALCDRRLTIPMHPGTDSLNLGVAAGVFLYEMTRRRG